MNDDLVSVITPAHNSACFIQQTLESVKSQTYKNWELIIVDDCSQDNTCEIVEEKARADDRIRLIRLPENRGPAISRNTAIRTAKGRYIAFLDSDDLWFSDKLRMQIGFMREAGCALSYTAYRKIDETGNIICNKVTVPERIDYRKLLLTNVIGCLTAVYDARILGEVYMPDILKRQDYALWLRILKAGYRAYGLNECLAAYRVRCKSVSSDKLRAASYQWRIYREIEKLPLYKSMWYFVNYLYYGYRKMNTPIPGARTRPSLEDKLDTP